MKAKDFQDFKIEHIRPQDITATNAPLDSVNLYLVLDLNEFIGRAGVPVVLLGNGLTTGKHRATWHPRGLAVDVAFNCSQDQVKIYDLWKLAIEVGFKGIGLYWNGRAYSMHLDKRPSPLALWGGTKKDGQWDYFSVFQDPRDRPLTT